MEVTLSEYHEAWPLYESLIAELPRELFQACPSFYRFLSPAGVMWRPDRVPDHDYVELTITGRRRWELLHSPHARTLLHAYAIQMYEQKNGHPWK